MKIIIGAPGSGKTKEILKMSAEKNIPILCESADRATRLLIKSQGYGYKIPTPIIYSEAKATDVVFVDDVERLLNAMLPCKVETITYNVEAKDDIISLA